MRINVFEGARRIALLIGAVWAVGCVVYGAISQRSAHITLAISGPGETPVVVAKCDGEDESRYALGTVDQVDTVSALLCFKAQRASDGRMLIPYMGYVRLPDGTDFPGVPQDLSEPALMARLTAAGYDVTKLLADTRSGAGGAAGAAGSPNIPAWGRWWQMGDRSSTEVSSYVGKVIAAFELPEPTLPQAREALRQARLQQWKDAMLTMAGGLVVGWLFVALTGWIVRGFLGIPRGKDSASPSAA